MLWRILLGKMDLQVDEPPPGENLGEITTLLRLGGDAGPQERERLVELLYPELKRVARSQMRRERQDHTLQATALVSEFYLQLAKHPSFSFSNRSHFLVCASRAMRRLLVDHARGRKAQKRGGGAEMSSVEEVAVSSKDHEFEAIEIDELLEKLAAEDPRMAQVVEMRYFGGLSDEEIGEALDVNPRTVRRDWQVARAWLFKHLRGKSNPDDAKRVGEDQTGL